jgi:hypothetical protein
MGEFASALDNFFRKVGLLPVGSTDRVGGGGATVTPLKNSGALPPHLT